MSLILLSVVSHHRSRIQTRSEMENNVVKIVLVSWVKKCIAVHELNSGDIL